MIHLSLVAAAKARLTGSVIVNARGWQTEIEIVIGIETVTEIETGIGISVIPKESRRRGLKVIAEVRRVSMSSRGF